MEILLKEEAYAIVGIALRCTTTWDVGFSSPSIRNVWGSSLNLGHTVRLPRGAEAAGYKDRTLKKTYEPDFDVFR